MLTRPQAEQILEEILATRSEMDDAECKSGAGNALQHALCAMSNRHDRNGGVVFVGIDEIARGMVPPFDLTPYLQAPLNVLDNDLIDSYIKQVKKIRPASQIKRLSREEVLRSVHAIAECDRQWHPTPTGLLFFCHEPQRYLPQSALEFLHLWEPELTSLGPDNSRWRLNRELTGTLPQIITEAETLLLERIATRGIINGFRRHDEPEYPRFAMREAIVNAVAHRDYTLRGSRIQVRLFPDRIEIHTPGGLPAPVTVDNIEDEQAKRLCACCRIWALWKSAATALTALWRRCARRGCRRL